MRFLALLTGLLTLLACRKSDLIWDRAMVVAEVGDGYLTVTLPNQHKVRLGEPNGLKEELLLTSSQQQDVPLTALFIPRNKQIPIHHSGLAYLFVESAGEQEFRQICQLKVKRAAIVAFPRGKIPTIPNCRILGITGERYIDLLIDDPPPQPVIFFFSGNVSFSG